MIGIPLQTACADNRYYYLLLRSTAGGGICDNDGFSGRCSAIAWCKKGKDRGTAMTTVTLSPREDLKFEEQWKDLAMPS